MELSDDLRRRAAGLVILALGLAILIALAPYATGLIGGLVAYVVFEPLYNLLRRRLSSSVSAFCVVLLTLALLLGPGVAFGGIIVNQAQSSATALLNSPLFGRLATLEIGEFQVGPKLAVIGEKIISWLGSSAFGLLGTATRLALNLTISLFILYYLLLWSKESWEVVRPYIPFSSANAEQLRIRFRDISKSTIIGTGLVACAQGALVGIGFWLTGLSNAAFWGVVTVIFAILPVVGSSLIWGPGALSLLLDHRYGAAIGLVLLGVLIVGQVDLLIRPLVFRRYAQVHPLVTLIGAFAGVPYFGLIGLLVGPLALSYFFELIQMYKEEYLSPPGG